MASTFSPDPVYLAAVAGMLVMAGAAPSQVVATGDEFAATLVYATDKPAV